MFYHYYSPSESVFSFSSSLQGLAQKYRRFMIYVHAKGMIVYYILVWTVYYIVINVFSYKKKKITPFLFFLGVYFYTLFSTIFIVFMIFFILINFKGVKKKISKIVKILKIIRICN